MENDLLFTLATKSEWKSYSASGMYKPSSFVEKGFISCYLGNQVEKAANDFFNEENELFLIVIDPLRIQVPIKHEKKDGEVYPNLYGAFSIDAVIDRISIKRNKKGVFSILVKHFD